MKNRIIHPLWIHLPSVAAIVYLIIQIVIDGPFTDSAPLHFNFQGEPDSYGSPWLTFGLALGLSLLFIAISAALDEIWARQEKAKTFNWLSLFDDIVVGVLVGMSLANIEFLKSGESLFHFPWLYLGITTGATTLAAILLEQLRPFRAGPQQAAAQDMTSLEKEFEKRAKENKAFVYWESQNPLYITLLTIILPLILLVWAVITWFSQPWASLVLLVVGLLLIMPYGGLRTVITQRDITVRFGLLGIRVLRLKITDIANLEVKEFAPLRDFGGYGIRFNGRTTAYYMRGNRGVKLALVNGREYLIGSDHAEQLLAIIRVMIGQPPSLSRTSPP
jgi:hypothetical protein